MKFLHLLMIVFILLSQNLTDSQSTASACLGVPPDPAHQEVPDQECPPAEPCQTRGPHIDLSSCEAVLTQKLKSLEIQNTLPGQADLVSHKSLALDPSCLLTPPNTPQGMELAEVEADLEEGARQQRRGNYRPVKLILGLYNKTKGTADSEYHCK